MTVFPAQDQVVDQPMRTTWTCTCQGMCRWEGIPDDRMLSWRGRVLSAEARKAWIASDDTLRTPEAAVCNWHRSL